MEGKAKCPYAEKWFVHDIDTGEGIECVYCHLGRFPVAKDACDECGLLKFMKRVWERE